MEEQVDKHWEELFKWICDNEGDILYDLVIEVSSIEGKTIRRSWRDRDKWIE
jgi:hypothetical protein